MRVRAAQRHRRRAQLPKQRPSFDALDEPRSPRAEPGDDHRRLRALERARERLERELVDRRARDGARSSIERRRTKASPVAIARARARDSRQKDADERERARRRAGGDARHAARRDGG